MSLAAPGVSTMFLSRPQYEFPVPARFAEPGCQHWRIIEMSLHAPWYLLTVDLSGQDDAEAPPSQTLFIAWETDLADVIRAADSSRIRGLLAIVPGWASTTGQWSSRQISEVWLDASEKGTSVTLLDVDGHAVDAGTFLEGRRVSSRGVLLLRLNEHSRTLCPQDTEPSSSRPERPSTE